MAQIQLKIGNLTSTKIFTDINAKKVFDLIFDANIPKWNISTDPPTAITYTPQQQLDLVVGIITTKLLLEAKQQLVKVRRSINDEATNTEAESITL